MGRNQKFAAIGHGVTLAAAYALVWVDKLSAEVWVAAGVAAISYVITQGRMAKGGRDEKK